MTNDLEHRFLEDALSMATRWIHAYEFPSLKPEAVGLCLVAFRLEEVFPLLWSGRRRAIRPSCRSQDNACDDREDNFVFHSNLQSGG